jgi:hypothetical protein
VRQPQPKEIAVEIEARGTAAQTSAAMAGVAAEGDGAPGS